MGDERVVVAMDNCPRQTVVVGPPESMATVEVELQRRRNTLSNAFRSTGPTTPRSSRDDPAGTRALPKLPLPGTTAADLLVHNGPAVPGPSEAIRELAIAQWAEPVRFSELIRNLYDDGVRLFVESGPRGNLSAFAEDVLPGSRSSRCRPMSRAARA